MFHITLKCDNAAFEDAPTQEIARILRDLANGLELASLPAEGKLRDINGNTVGKYALEHYE